MKSQTNENTVGFYMPKVNFFDFFICLDHFKLVAERNECPDAEIRQGYLKDITQCYERCIGKSSMFLFGRSGSSRCNKTGYCSCFCESAASQIGTCKQQFKFEYNLYKYIGEYDQTYISIEG